MSKVYSVLIVMVVLFCGCAHQKTYNYAEYRRSFINDMSFYSQYEIIYKVKTKNGEKLIVSPFLSNSNKYIPKNIVRLHFGLNVINPNREKFVVWIDYQFIGIDDDELIQRISKLIYESQALPEEFINVDMPYDTNIHSKVIFSVSVISKGKILYKSTEALYKIKGS